MYSRGTFALVIIRRFQSAPKNLKVVSKSTLSKFIKLGSLRQLSPRYVIIASKMYVDIYFCPGGGDPAQEWPTSRVAAV